MLQRFLFCSIQHTDSWGKFQVALGSVVTQIYKVSVEFQMLWEILIYWFTTQFYFYLQINVSLLVFCFFKSVFWKNISNHGNNYFLTQYCIPKTSTLTLWWQYETCSSLNYQMISLLVHYLNLMIKIYGNPLISVCRHKVSKLHSKAKGFEL